MRIIRGRLKSRRIQAPKNLPVRPTTDFAKEGLFNIIENNFNIEELAILDLFAGTGSISYEFASREAKQITSIDSNPKCINFIKSSCEKFEIENIIPIRADVYKFLERNKQKYDIIFADPPYDIGQDKFTNILDSIINNNMINEGGWLIIEHSKQIGFPSIGLEYEHRKYGNVNFSFFKK